ncbi:MAG: cell division protein ZapA [Mariprofundales bacterium]|nr:cell division protein ZapA [Mariprofundales bacterium]
MNHVVEIKLLDRTHRIVTRDDPEIVKRSALRVQQKVDELRRGGAVVGGERLVLLAALNLAEDLLRAEKMLEDGSQGLTSVLDSIESLSGALANAPLR